MSVFAKKLELLRSYLFAKDVPSGAALVIYPPEEELAFRAGYEEVLQELGARGIPIVVLDFRTLVFEALEERNLLERAFKLDAKGDANARKSLATIVQREVLGRIQRTAQESPGAVLLCKNTAALFPWISFSSILKTIEGRIDNPLIIPFPGIESGPSLHFMGVQNGYDYRAMRI